MISYELHTLRKGAPGTKWKLDSVFEDRETAIHEATLTDDRNNFSGVRVIEERYDEQADKTKTTVVFRGGAKFNEAKARVAAEAAMPFHDKFAPVVDVEARLRRARPAKPASKPKPRSPVFPLLVFLMMGVGALYVLHEMA